MSDYKLLIVDDEIDFLHTLVKRIQKREVDVVGVDSGEAALQAIAESPPDVVLLDVRMPGIDGIETLKTIKHDFPLIEVIMLTGHANLEVAIQGMELGAFDYLVKPMNIDDILYKVEDAYSKKILQEKKIARIQGDG